MDQAVEVYERYSCVLGSSRKQFTIGLQYCLGFLGAIKHVVGQSYLSSRHPC